VTAVVLRGDAASLPLPDASVDLICTSPPYYGQRSYTDGGEHYAGQIGSEDTPAEYIANLLACTSEWVRVLKPEGSIFVNLGDSYHSGKGAPGRTTTDPKNAGRNARRTQRSPLDYGLDLPRKTLLGLPWRYAIGCMDQGAPHLREKFLAGLVDHVLDGTITQDEFWRRAEAYDAEPKPKGLGLILRAEIIWNKPNGLPEKARDRAHRTHEQLFHFTRQPVYFSSCDAIREPHAEWTLKAYGYERKGYNRRSNASRVDRGGFAKAPEANPLGKMPGSVWEIAPQPLSLPAFLGVDHFAPMPMELARRCILGWSPPRGIVADPFGGVGTTALVAEVFGRTVISVDLSHDYGRAARWRVADPGERARAQCVPKPPPVPDGQGSLFEAGEAS
jgi:DNA modification methylase